ncbi:MAG: AraC family transcriptional regulator [Myxococcaceae bacterium]
MGTRALGTMMFGKPLEADIQAMIPFFEVGADPRFKGHSSFVDCRGLESVDALAFAKLLAYLNSRRHVWGPNVGRQAILHPMGMVGVLVAGALHVVKPPYPFDSFGADSQRAFEWSGVGDLHADVEALREAAGGTPELLRRLRPVLRQEPQLENADVAKRLGFSERTLQRRLVALGTSLRDERQRLVVTQVEELLAGTDLDLDAIAAQVGLSSASHLVTRFRAVHGVTPGEWRTRAKAQ